MSCWYHHHHLFHFRYFFPDYPLEQMLQLTTQASSSSFLIMCDVGRSHMMTHFLQMVD